MYNVHMFRKLVNYVEKQDISITQWIVGFIGIIFVRFFLEAISSPSSTEIIASDASTLVHYSIFYFVVALGLSFIIYCFTKNKNIYKTVLFFLPIIWLPPILDIIFTAGAGSNMSYFFTGNRLLLVDFLTFFPPRIVQGITLGIRTEIFLVVIATAWYVWGFRKSFLVTFISTFSSFVFIFCLLAAPGLLYTISHPSFFASPVSETLVFIKNSIIESKLTGNIIHGALLPKNYNRLLDFGFNALMSQLEIILGLIILGLWFYRTQKEKFISIVKNSRPERILFYLILMSFGLGMAYIQNLGVIKNWVDILSIIVLFISWYSAWMFAVHINDIADEKIDAVSNTNRPIITGKLSNTEMRQVSIIWLIISLIGSFAVGYYPFFMNIVFTIAYYVYSANPLRFKRVPILSSFLISIACLSTIMAGFFYLSEDKQFTIFPAFLALGLLLVFTLAVNIRDVKDIAGDKADGIYTLPVLFGKYGINIVGSMFSLSFFLLPIFLSKYYLLYLTIPFGSAGYFLVVREVYKKKYIFYLFYTFAAAYLLMYLFFGW